MKLVQKYDWSADKASCSISTAVRRELDGTAYDQGQLEDIAATVRNCQQFLADLTERLFDKGALSREDITTLLSGYEVAE